MSSFLQLAYWKSFVTRRRYSLKEMPDQTGKVALVTGANSGLGFQTAVMLGAKGAHVFLACRSPEKGQDAIQRAKVEIIKVREKLKKASAKTTKTAAASTTSQGAEDVWEPKLEFLQLDLNDIRNVKAAADAFLAKGLPLHILINNAGIYQGFSMNESGFEEHFAVNHLGHFVLTLALLECLKQSQPSRIVNVSSFTHEYGNYGGIDFNTLRMDTGLWSLQLYGRSKLMNILFAKALARRLVDTKVHVNAINPGVVATELSQSWGSAFGRFSVRLIFKSIACPAAKSAMTQLYAATSPEIEDRDLRGRYFNPTGIELRPRPMAFDEDLQERLWDYSITVMNQYLRAQGSDTGTDQKVCTVVVDEMMNEV